MVFANAGVKRNETSINRRCFFFSQLFDDDDEGNDSGSSSRQSPPCADTNKPPRTDVDVNVQKKTTMTDNGAGSAAAADLKKHTHKNCRIKIPVRWVGGNAQKLRRTNTIFFRSPCCCIFYIFSKLTICMVSTKIHGNFIFVFFISPETGSTKKPGHFTFHLFGLSFTGF